MSSAPVGPGELIHGKYRVDQVLGEGGMGVVVAAVHVALDQRVAIKFLLPAMLAHPEVVERFAREARAASKIESDHVARVTDVDALPNGTPFMVMEYLDGHDLSVVRRTRAPLPVATAVKFVLEACEAIGEAHRLGIVHRDIKPSNLFLARRSDGRTRVKVLDFGISKLSAAPDASSELTSTQAVMGSAEYMSPEQMLASRDVDLRTDIWALGVTLFELLTAHVPFPGESAMQVCALVMSTEPPLPSTYRPELPTALDLVVRRCLHRQPAERFSSVSELVAALRPFADQTGAALPAAAEPFVAKAVTMREIGSNGALSLPVATSVLAVSTDADVPKEPAGTMSGTEAQILPRPLAKKWLSVGALLGGAAVVALGAVLLSTGSSPKSSAKTAAVTAAGSPPSPEPLSSAPAGAGSMTLLEPSSSAPAVTPQASPIITLDDLPDVPKLLPSAGPKRSAGRLAAPSSSPPPRHSMD